MKRWIMLPLKELTAIEERLEAVNYLLHQQEFSEHTSQSLKQVGDLERLISKVALGKISPREVMHLKRALDLIEPIRNACIQSSIPSIKKIGDQLNVCQLIREKIGKELHTDPPALVNKGGVMNEGVNAELDE